MINCVVSGCVLWALVFGLSPAGADELPPGPDVVTAAVPRDWPPQYAVDSRGRPSGFAIDVMEEVARRAGLEVRYVIEEDFPRILRALEEGRADLVPNLGITPERMPHLAFTSPIETFVISVFVRKGTTDIAGPDDLAGHRVAVVAGNVAADLLQERGDIDLVVYEDPRTALFELLAGDVEALVYPRPVLEALARQVGVERRIRAVGAPLVEVKRGIAVRRGENALLARLDEAVRDFVGTPDYERIYLKWYRDDAARYWTTTHVLWWSAVGLGLVLGAAATWRYRLTVAHNRALRQRIAERDRAEEGRRHLEEQLRQSQKMEAVGRLAGGIAHDFNNLLVAITSFTGFARRALPTDSPARDDLDEVLAAADRAGRLTAQLLTFSRRQISAPKVFRPASRVMDMDKMLRRVLGEDIELVTRLPDQAWSIKMDPTQFEQVLLNLVVNARDALPGGGKLTIELEHLDLTAGVDAVGGQIPPGEYVAVRVTDDGVGMSPEVLENVFEPFFTTKPKEQGTGLGLATSYGIISQADGHITVASRRGEGTTFTIYVPRERSTVPAAEHAVDVPRGGGAETVLLVEDEPAVRRAIARALGELGYTVLEADSGERALELFTEHLSSVALLLTDVVMPQMGGAELARRARELSPDARVIYMSGYTEDALIREAAASESSTFIQKPFTPESLASTIRKLLDRA